LKAGFRASGNGSADTMRPTRMSILLKSSIDAVGPADWLAMRG
jgi:hypothetical protein